MNLNLTDDEIPEGMSREEFEKSCDYVMRIFLEFKKRGMESVPVAAIKLATGYSEDDILEEDWQKYYRLTDKGESMARADAGDLN